MPIGNLDPLSRLAIQYGTDKFGAHQYTPHYHHLFAARREEPLRLLEIGVGGYGMPLAGGQSLLMWADYFPNARVTGLDLEPKRMPVPPRVALVQGSQTDTAFLDQVWADHGPFDIVIDDGSHQVAHVNASFHHLYPRMPEDGIYVVEDTQTAFWPGLGGNPEGKGSIFDLAHEIALAMHEREQRPPRPDAAWHPYGAITQSVQILRNMAVFQRGPNLFPSNGNMSMDDPLVIAMIETLAAENIRNPAPGAFMTRIDMANWAGRFDLAIAALHEGLAVYPFHAGLILAGIRLFDHIKLYDDVRVLAGRLKVLYPHDPAVAALVAAHPSTTEPAAER